MHLLTALLLAFTLTSLSLARSTVPLSPAAKPTSAAAVGKCTEAQRLKGAKLARESTTYGDPAMTDRVPFADKINIEIWLNGGLEENITLTAQQRREVIGNTTHNPAGVVWISDFYPVQPNVVAIGAIRKNTNLTSYNHKTQMWFFSPACEIEKIQVLETNPMHVNGTVKTGPAPNGIEDN